MDALAFAAVCVVCAPIYAFTALAVWACCRRRDGGDINPPPSRDELIIKYDLHRHALYDGVMRRDLTSDDDMATVRAAYESAKAADLARMNQRQTDAMMIASCADTAAAHYADSPMMAAAFKMAAILARTVDAHSD